MSIGTEGLVNGAVASPNRKLVLWAGRGLVGIGALHLVYGTVVARSHLAGWIGGALHGASGEGMDELESQRDFWALLGSLAVPLIVVGLLLSRMASTGQEVPRAVGWILAVWVLVSAWVLFPSGFLLGIVPVALLLLAGWRR
ncbi:DUF6463 family protein [Streptomyces sp. NPDC089799]|uniref:DUF6463 family protein n=1 Tax=Streptomyces sp. NPDC089799 TaxID=3155066 RepID=UPI003426CE46